MTVGIEELLNAATFATVSFGLAYLVAVVFLKVVD